MRIRTALVCAAALVATGAGVVPASAEQAAGRERARTEITQPGPPTSGPGSTTYKYVGWRVTSGGTGANAYYVFTPKAPVGGAALPKKLPLAVVMHGYGEYSGYDQMYELVRHTVLTGNVVIYPRWQTDLVTPCPGPYDIEPCMSSAVTAIRGGLRSLHAQPRRVQPDLERTSYFGFSFGGIITANLANRWRQLDLPKPRAIFLDDPHDGGLTGGDEPALDDSMTGIPRGVKLECHSGAEGVISESGMAGGSCNALFPMLGHIPADNKAIVMTRPDAHGTPALSSDHGVCAGGKGAADAYDWNFCWKVWDALRVNAYTGRWAAFALGLTLEHTSLGSWSDGTPASPLVVQKAGPLVPS